MTSTFDRTVRRPLLRRAGGALFGLLSLTLVVACSNYGTTGSGGTTGAGGAGAGAGGAIATPSGGNNVGASGPTGSQESRTGNAPPGVTQIVPTSETGRSNGMGAESTGTPMNAGSGGVAATRDAVTSGPGSDTVVRTPAASPTATTAPR